MVLTTVLEQLAQKLATTYNDPDGATAVRQAAAEILRLEREADNVKQVEFPKKVGSVTAGFREKIKRLEDELANMRAEAARPPEASVMDSKSVSLLESLRNRGWAVAVHNDYRQNGVDHTFWLFTKDGQCTKGEGLTDAEALQRVDDEIRWRFPRPTPWV